MNKTLSLQTIIIYNCDVISCYQIIIVIVKYNKIHRFFLILHNKKSAWIKKLINLQIKQN